MQGVFIFVDWGGVGGGVGGGAGKIEMDWGGDGSGENFCMNSGGGFHPTHTVSVSIFNQENYLENRRFCEAVGGGCFYKCARPISPGPQKNIFVLECINDLNQIGGIGLIYCEFSRKTYKNHVDVYSDNKYSQFCFNYAGRFRIGREMMTQEELEVLSLIEDFCFRGKGHVKRVSGIGRFPVKHIRKIEEILQVDFVEWVRDLFRSRSWRSEVA